MRLAAEKIAASLIEGVAGIGAAAVAPGEATARKNMLQLIYLRWMAVIGQLATIAIAQTLFQVELPIVGMGMVLIALVALNLASALRLERSSSVTNLELFLALALDALALTVQLYFSGGATNPFTSLYLLQVILAAVLLQGWSIWGILAITTLGFCILTRFYRPISTAGGQIGDLSGVYIAGLLAGFVINAALLVIFVTRITANLRARDARLADLRQRAADEDHVVRMGLLASGAAHELGTPLATLDVILSDWRRMPKLAEDPELAQEIEDMRAEVARCKAIMTGILLSAGEARGGDLVITTLKAFLADVVDDWRASRPTAIPVYNERLGEDVAIVSDSALKQVIHNVLDNAHEVSPGGFRIEASRWRDDLVLAVKDAGPGFSPDMLADFGKPYKSSKGRPGGGLGLFLVVNVLRKLGGQAMAENPPDGGARVTLILPLAALMIGDADAR